MSGAAYYPHLLAKSSSDPLNPRVSETLKGHILDVISAAGAIIAHTPTLLQIAGLEQYLSMETLGVLLRRAAALHDLGKANSDFQAMVRRKQAGQAFRHELLSAWFAVSNREFHEWFFQSVTPNNRIAIILAVLGHHLRIRGELGDYAVAGTSNSVTLLVGHKDMQPIMSSIADNFGLPPCPKLTDVSIDCHESSPLSALQKWLLDTAAPWFEVSSCEEKRMLALIKALLIASDVAGSALPRSGKSVQCWVKDALRDTLTSDHLSQLVSKRLGGSPPRAFQTEVHGAGPLAFVRAGCGSGKTAAAYLWASRHAQGRRLFFCYPTTGTATEGFRDYVLESELKDEASLLHGRAAVDLEDILGVEDDDTSSAQRLESLKAWSPLLIICTVDRVLGLMQNNRSGLYAYPALAKGAFVFDEIHLFDDRMFGSLIRFMRDGLPGAPVLLMTASLPASRLAALKKIATARGATLQVINGPRDLEELPRYCLTAVSPQPDWDRVQATLSHPTRNKVLWVSNTVERAMNFVNEASARDLAPLCYHSRFRYEDRVQRHKRVIDAFKSPAPAIVIATQVCEVSLDISADLLISDLAPIPSMIQRLGRLNRRAKPGACDPREAEFLSVDSTLPYDEYSFNIDVSRAWVEELIMDRAVSDRAVSQSDLAAAFKEQKNVFDMRNQRSEWLDGGIHSFPATLREADTGISVLLPEDAPSCLLPNSKPDRDQIIRKTIPMPMNRAASDWIKWKRIGYIPVAPPGRIKYSKEVGGSWAKS